MPTKANCVTCHSPQGKIVAECITCHTFHAPPQAIPTLAVNSDRAGDVDLVPAPGSPVKRMLLGKAPAMAQAPQSFH
jgi:hypothetical protein